MVFHVNDLILITFIMFAWRKLLLRYINEKITKNINEVGI